MPKILDELQINGDFTVTDASDENILDVNRALNRVQVGTTANDTSQLLVRSDNANGVSIQRSNGQTILVVNQTATPSVTCTDSNFRVDLASDDPIIEVDPAVNRVLVGDSVNDTAQLVVRSDNAEAFVVQDAAGTVFAAVDAATANFTVQTGGADNIFDVDRALNRVQVGTNTNDAHLIVRSDRADAFEVQTAGGGGIAIVSTTIEPIGLSVFRPNRPPASAVADVPSAVNYRGALLWVTDQSGGPAAAISDGANWRLVTLGATIST